ncbi:hypothetical protein HYDPIDRAFT_126365 [Hydnomerulius pinastri MD-312]|nr:hypothetical protein HYDPIDRAFT_126365 [Hydnomerulius pinastri MD-312]
MAPDSEQRLTSHNSFVASDTTANEVQNTPSIDAAAPLPPPIKVEDEPFTHNFFDGDEGTIAARKAWLKTSLIAVGLVWFIILAILSIYWAALGRSATNIVNLSGYVVDFDGGEIGQAVTQAFSSIHSQEQLSWLVIDAAEFPNGPSDVQAALLDDRCWAAVTINKGATNNLFAAINSNNATYNTSQAVSAYLTEARNENIHRTYIWPMVTTILSNVTQTFGVNFARQLASRSDLSTLMSTAPQLVTLPINYAVYELRPFDVPAASAVDYVGLIYLLILSFVLTNQLLAANVESGLGRRLTLGSLIMMRLLWPVMLYFFISLMYSLLSLAFGVPFDRVFGHAGFVIYWMMSWTGMAALGLALEAMITIMTVKFISLFLILWIIVNVSVAYYPIEILPAIFRYGFAMPFYNVSRTVRAIVFNTKNQIGLNFGVQIAWVVVSCITLPFFQWLVRRREVMAWRNSQVQRQGKA